MPSLTPRATAALWRRLVRHPRLQAAAPGDCRPSRQVLYAATDWLRLATRLAATPSPCADYLVSIPPTASDKTAFRAGQAWRIRALGPRFHALAEISVAGWRAWASSTGRGWYAAGVEARRRMAAAGFDVGRGDGWVVDELSSAVRRGDGSSRQEMRDLVRGLYAPAPAARGAVFVIGSSQPSTELSVYRARLQDWYEDAGFWADMSRYVGDWAQEVYGDVRAYAVPGSTLAARRDALTEYLRHPLALAAAAPASGSVAASYLAGAYGPLANGAWRYGASFGWTDVPIAAMEDYVSAQAYATRRVGDRGGFAWKPRNATGLPPAEFAAQTGALLDRLATAIRDAAATVDPADPGVGACGPAGRNEWCTAELAGAAFTDVWQTFAAWRPSVLAFSATPPVVAAGTCSGAFTVQLRTSTGVPLPATAPVTVTLTSSSASGSFATSPAGPWSPRLDVTIPSGAATTSFAYADPAVGAASLTASAPGKLSAGQAITVTPPVPPTMVRVATSAVTGGGRVVGTGGIDCGPLPTCQAVFPPAPGAPAPVLVELGARPGPGGVFIGWVGACAGQGPACTLSLVQDASTTAIFTALLYPAPRHLLRRAASREIASEGADDARRGALACALGGQAGWGMRPVPGRPGTLTAVARPGPATSLARVTTEVLGARTRACAAAATPALAASVLLGAVPARADAHPSAPALLPPVSPTSGGGQTCRWAKAALCLRARAAAARDAATGARRAVVAEALAVTSNRYASAVRAGDRQASSLQLAVARVYLNEWVSATDARAATRAALRRALGRLGLERALASPAAGRRVARALLHPPRQVRAVVRRYAGEGLGGRAALLRSLVRLAGRRSAGAMDLLVPGTDGSERPALHAAAKALSVADVGLILRALETERPPSPGLAAALGAAWEAVAACDGGSAPEIRRLLDVASASAPGEATFAGSRLALLRAAVTPLARQGAGLRCR